jgi:BolA protein
MDHDDRAARLRETLERAFAPLVLEVRDESALHAGHAGARGGGQTHYQVRMTSARFQGMSRVARSRLVHEAVAAEFGQGLHALQLTLRAPEDVA